MEFQELKDKIRFFISYGSNLKEGITTEQLKELKGYLEEAQKLGDEKLKEILAGGRSYICYLTEIDRRIKYPENVYPNPYPYTPPITPDNSRPPTPQPIEPKPTPTPEPTPQPEPPKPEPGPIKPDEPKPPVIDPAQGEIAKYDKILSDIKAEITADLLEDGNKWDKEIKALNIALLPPTKQPENLQKERQQKLKELRDKEKEEKWQAWFKKRNILNIDDQQAWRTYKDETTAETVFINALSKDKDDKEWNPALTDNEKELINNSTSPAGIQNNQIKIKNTRENVSRATKLLNEIKNWADLIDLPNDDEIKAGYDQTPVPAELKYSQLSAERDKRRIELFKLAFEGQEPSNLTDEDIDKWRSSETGLNKLGTEERTAFNNGWLFSEIIQRKIPKYTAGGESESNINPLIVKKDQLETALNILADINSPNKTTFKSLPENYRKEEIDALPTNLPGKANPEALRARIQERRSTFSLSLDQPDDDGLTPELLQKARDLEKGVYVAKGKPPAPADIINQVLRWEMTKDRSPVNKLEWSEPQDLDEWLTSKENRGYRIESEPPQEIKGKTYTGIEILDQENNKWGNPNSPEFDRGKQGRLLLPFFNKKVGFDPDNPEAFLTEPNNDIKGHLPFATGIGKTTKTVCCLVKGGIRKIILVLPTESLALSAAGSHNDWLQDYICPIHEEKHGEYKVGLFEVIDNGLSILRPGDLLGYLARNLLTFTSKGIKGISKSPSDADFEEKVKQVKEGRKLKKDQHLILYDEADEANPTYQTIIEEAINQGYKCIKMSATFPGVPWSITTTNPIKSQLITGFKDDMLVAADGEPKNIAIFIRETETRTVKGKVLEPLTEEQKKLLAPYSYVVFDKSNAGAAEGITRGMPRGTLFFVSPIYGRGFTFFIQATILTNWMQTKKLGGGWIYGEPNTQRLPLSDQGQERGRVGRTEAGDAWWLNSEIGSIKGAEDIGTILTRAVLTGDLEKLSKTYGTLTKAGIDFIRAAVAWPDKFGLLPEEILIGVQVGGAAKNINPSFPEKPPTSYDPDLWDRHKKIIKKSTMPKDTASNILKLMIANLIKRKTKENNFPDNIRVKIESPLIEQVGWSEDPKKNKANIQEVREVVNGVITENIPDPEQNKFKDEKLFNKIVKLHKLVLDLKITIEREETDEWIDRKDKSKGKKKKDNLTLSITSGSIPSSKRRISPIGDYYGINNNGGLYGREI